MVVAGKEQVARIGLQAVGQGGDAFQIQMVGGLIQNEGIGLAHHQAAEHTANLFAAGEHLGGLVYFIAAEQHPAQEAPQIGLGLVGGILPQPVDQAAVEVFEIGGIVLGKIALADGHAPLEAAFVGLDLAHQNAKQCRRARFIVAHKGDLVALAHGEGHVVQHFHAVDSLGQVLHGQDVLAGFPLRLEAHEGILPAGGGHLLDLHGVQYLFAAGGLTALGLVGGKPADKFLQVADLFLPLLVLLAHQLLEQLAGIIPEVVVARIHFAGLVIHVHDVGAHRVQEVTVMADHDDNGAAVHQKIFQPFGAFHVQTVGGLVQQNDGRMAEQGLRQQDFHLLPAIQRAHLGLMQLRGDADAVEQLGRFGLRIPAVHFGKFAFQHRGPLAVLIAEIRLHVERVFFLHDVVQPPVAHNDRVHHGVFVVLEVVLFQHGHAVFLLDGHGAGGGGQLAGDDPEQGGLARAVGSDDAVAVIRLEKQIHVLVQKVSRKLKADVV